MFRFIEMAEVACAFWDQNICRLTSLHLVRLESLGPRDRVLCRLEANLRLSCNYEVVMRFVIRSFIALSRDVCATSGL